MKKYTLDLTAAVLFVFLSLHLSGQDFAGGTGTPEDPYQVETAGHLNNVRNYLTSCFKQTADIDLDAVYTNWVPIAGGGTDDVFTGNYDGQDYTISDLSIDRPETNNVGLFGHLGEGSASEPAVIRNVELLNVNVTGARGTGSLAGRVTGNIYTLIEYCSASGGSLNRNVTGDAATGGLVGSNNSVQQTPGGTNNPIVSECWADIDVEYSGADPGGDNDAEKFGGLVGCSQKGTIINSYAKGSVTVDKPSGSSWVVRKVGGIVGCILYRGVLERSYSTAGVSTSGGVDDVGGLLGNVGSGGNAGVVEYSYWDTGTSGQSSSAGGTGLTTSQMKVAANFVGFDFTNIWDIDGSTNDGYPFLRVIPATTYVTWTGSNSTDWDISGNWENEDLPGSTDIAYIPAGLTNYPVVSTVTTYLPKGLSIAENASVTIDPDGALTISDLLLNDTTGGIVLKSGSTGTGSLIHDNRDIPVTIERYITGSPTLTDMKYHTVSVPLTAGSGPLSGLFLGSYLYGYDASTQQWDPLGTSTTTPLSVDQGYLIYYPGADITYSMTGYMNNGEFTAAVEYTDAEYYNLVPNPYPSAVDWDAASGWTKTNLSNAIWIWDPSSGNYASYIDGSGTNGGSQYIPAGQAFFVQASDGGPELAMNNDVRVHNSQDFFRETEQESNALRITASANNYRDELVVRFKTGATCYFDGAYDAAKMYGMDGAPQLYSVSDDDHNLSVNSLPFTPEVVSIPVGFELDTIAQVSLVFSSPEMFEPQIPIKLIDNLTGDIIDLEASSRYDFMHDPVNDPLRFELQLNSPASVGGLQRSPVSVFYSNRQLHVTIPEKFSGLSRIDVFDPAGRGVFSTCVQPGSSSLPLHGMSPGMYVVRCTADGWITMKKILYN